MSINAILQQMQDSVDHPNKVVDEFLKIHKRPVIGCAPEYCPEEIVYAAGMLPIGIWGSRANISKANMYFPAFACSLVQTILELGMRGVYDKLSAMIIPAHCDHLKCFGQDWRVAVPQVRFIPVVHPNNRHLDAAITYLRSEYVRVRKELEVIGRQPISDADLNNAIDVYDNHRQTMRQFTRIARDYPITISPRIRHLIIKSGFFIDKAEHTQMVKSIISELIQQPKEEWAGKRVVLTGIMAEPDELLDLLSTYKIAIAADDLAQESRQFRVSVPEGTDPLERLARRWSLMEGCPLLINPEKPRRLMIPDLVQESGADGVIACMMKFCDPEEFDFPFYKRTLEQRGIPLLHLEVDVNGHTMEQARTRIQSFAEMLTVI